MQFYFYPISIFCRSSRDFFTRSNTIGRKVLLIFWLSFKEQLSSNRLFWILLRTTGVASAVIADLDTTSIHDSFIKNVSTIIAR